MINTLKAELEKKFPGIWAYADAPMKDHTSFHIGGPADLLVCPGREEELCYLAEMVKTAEIPLFIMGNGTNLLVSDKGFRGVILKTAGAFQNIRLLGGGLMEAESGALLSRLAVTAAENGLAGLEFAHGIPGTVGGAVAMNAGAYDGEMAGVVFETDYRNETGVRAALSAIEHRFAYRRSAFTDHSGWVAVRTRFRLSPGKKQDIHTKMKELSERRRASQPLSKPSAGSTFKRPEGHFAGKLISDCGLQGFRVGGAEVSDKHAGFIVNRGGALASDVYALIRHIQKQVYERFHVTLEPEIKLLGDFD